MHYAKQASRRDEALALAYASGGCGLKEIGQHFGLHYSRVGHIVAMRRGRIQMNEWQKTRPRGHELDITAEIKTAKRRVIEYVLLPVQRAGRESLRAR